MSPKRMGLPSRSRRYSTLIKALPSLTLWFPIVDLHVVSIFAEPPLGLRNKCSPAETVSGSSYFENSQVAVKTKGSLSLLSKAAMSALVKTFSPVKPLTPPCPV